MPPGYGHAILPGAPGCGAARPDRNAPSLQGKFSGHDRCRRTGTKEQCRDAEKRLRGGSMGSHASSDPQSAVAPRQPRSHSALVFVVAAPLDARLVAPHGGAVEPLVHAPEAV